MTMEKSCEKVPENGRRPIVKAVNDFLDELRKLEMPLHSVLVMQNDTLLAECYSQQYQMCIACIRRRKASLLWP